MLKSYPSLKLLVISHPVSEVPKTTLQFNESLEGLTEFRRVVIFMVVVHCTERID